MITKEKFEAYVVVQKSGLTNMFHIKNVTFAAEQICNIELTKKDCLEIMKDYSGLKEKFNVKI